MSDNEQDTSYLKTLSNGAIYDTRVGRIVNSKNVTTKITTQNAVALSRRRQELKRDAIMVGAQSAIGKVKQREPAHEYEFLEVLGEVNMLRAMDRNNVKGVDASRFLIQESGLGERAAEGDNVANDPLHVIGAMALEFIRQKLHAGENG